uniref:Hypotherical protein n=1 Tax=Homo sapiens TaxID=9606 RepID=Q5W7F8_HUMAN|nr:hypotherical protein [Homo sapiens]
MEKLHQCYWNSSVWEIQVWKQSWGTYPQGWWRPDQENLSLTTLKLAE